MRVFEMCEIIERERERERERSDKNNRVCVCVCMRGMRVCIRTNPLYL